MKTCRSLAAIALIGLLALVMAVPVKAQEDSLHRAKIDSFNQQKLYIIMSKKEITIADIYADPFWYNYGYNRPYFYHYGYRHPYYYNPYGYGGHIRYTTEKIISWGIFQGLEPKTEISELDFARLTGNDKMQALIINHDRRIRHGKTAALIVGGTTASAATFLLIDRFLNYQSLLPAFRGHNAKWEPNSVKEDYLIGGLYFASLVSFGVHYNLSLNRHQLTMKEAAQGCRNYNHRLKVSLGLWPPAKGDK